MNLIDFAVSFTLSISLALSWTTSNVDATSYPYPSAGSNMVTRKPNLWFDSIQNSVSRFGGFPYNAQPVAVWDFPTNDQGVVGWTSVHWRHKKRV
jgi:hypothetical protein